MKIIHTSLLLLALMNGRYVFAEGSISTDGSVGPAQDLTGPNFAVGQELGTLSGNNLFHSFSHFNLSNGQSATFTGDAAVQNVISRVTGGEVSSIDGKLISTIGNAGFYFINPAGIVFGEHAAIDVPGVFHASTANELQFADGGKFSANPLAGSSLSMAAPAAFGFLAHTAANNGLLRVDGATLEVKPGQALDLVAGKIEATNATLGAAQTTVDKADTETLGREIRLVAMQGAGTVGLDRAGGALPLPLPDAAPSATNAGDITLQDTSIIASGNGGGRIGVWGGDVVVSTRDTSIGINAVNTGSTHATSQHGIEIKTDNLTLDGITIRAHAQESGNAGDIRVQSAQDTTLRQGGRVISAALENSAGNTGNINVSAGRDLVVDGLNTPNDFLTEISTKALDKSTGNTGDVNIQTGRNVLVNNGGWIHSNTFAKQTGDMGNVNVHAQGDVEILNASRILNLIGTQGKAGTLSVTADGNISVDGLILFEANDGEHNADAGSVNVHARGDLNVTPEGEIASKTFANRNAAEVNVSAGGNLGVGGLIYTINPKATGGIGNITVHAQGDINILNNGEISSDIYTHRKAGEVVVSANGNILNDGFIGITARNGEHNADSGRVSVTTGSDFVITPNGSVRSQTLADRNAANLDVNVGKNLTVYGSISSASVNGNSGFGNAGNVRVHAGGDILLDAKNVFGSGITSSVNPSSKGSTGNIGVSAGGKLTLINKGAISTLKTNDFGHTGDTEVNVQGDILLDNGRFIDNSTSSSKNAGNIKVMSGGNLTMNDGDIASQTSAEGDAGNVLVDVGGRIDLSNDSLILSGTKTPVPGGNGGKVSVNAPSGIRIDHSYLGSATFATGNAGDTSVNTAGDLVVIGGVITSFSNGSGTAGNLDIYANNILLKSGTSILSGSYNVEGSQAGNINISFAHWLTADESSEINTISSSGNGGAVAINGGELLSLRNSRIQTNAKGNGGNITVNADILLMDTGLIQANANSGNGGEINLNLKALIPSGDSLTVGGAKVAWDYLTPNFNVIQAVSETGVSGVPNITAPQLNIVGALVGLNNPELDLSRVGHDPCSDTVRQSTLKRSGKGGVPLFNKGQDGYTLEHLLETKPDVAAGTQQAAHTPNAQQDCKPKLAEKL